MSAFDKTPLNSKKFIAYQVADLTWTILIAGGLFRLERLVAAGSTTVALELIVLLGWMVFIRGFLEVAYLTNQTSLDKFVRLAEIERGKQPAPKE